MDRWDAQAAIDYSDVEKLREVLIGKRVQSVRSVGDGFAKTIEYDLGGVVLVAHATDGGCACSNGCFTVDTELESLAGTIMNVEVEERAIPWAWDSKEGGVIEPRSISSGSAVIRIFVYTDLGKSELVKSEGGDNGYYGWGFWLSVEPKVITTTESQARLALTKE